MAADPETLERLWNVAIRLHDANEGTRVAAANGFASMCRSEGIDPRDYQIVPANGHADKDVEARWREYREMMREAYPAEAKAHDLLDELRAEVKALKAEVRNLRSQIDHKDDEQLPFRLLREALVAVAGPDYQAPMNKTQLRRTVEAAGWNYSNFLHEIGYRNQAELPTQTVTPWVRITARSMGGTPPPSRKKGKG